MITLKRTSLIKLLFPGWDVFSKRVRMKFSLIVLETSLSFDDGFKVSEVVSLKFCIWELFEIKEKPVGDQETRLEKSRQEES